MAELIEFSQEYELQPNELPISCRNVHQQKKVLCFYKNVGPNSMTNLVNFYKRSAATILLEFYYDDKFNLIDVPAYEILLQKQRKAYLSYAMVIKKELNPTRLTKDEDCVMVTSCNLNGNEFLLKADYFDVKEPRDGEREKISKELEIYKRTVIKYWDLNSHANAVARNTLKIVSFGKSHGQLIGQLVRILRCDDIEPIPTGEPLGMLAISKNVGVRQSTDTINLGLNENGVHGTTHVIIDVGKEWNPKTENSQTELPKYLV